MNCLLCKGDKIKVIEKIAKKDGKKQKKRELEREKAIGKILSRQQLKPEIEKLKKQGKKIIATSGAFDILHAAHVRFLKKAKSIIETKK